MKLISEEDIFTEIQHALRQRRIPGSGPMTKADWLRVARHLNKQKMPLKPGRKYCTARGVERFYHLYVQKSGLQFLDRTKQTDEGYTSYMQKSGRFVLLVPRNKLRKMAKQLRRSLKNKNEDYTSGAIAQALNDSKFVPEDQPEMSEWWGHTVTDLLLATGRDRTHLQRVGITVTNHSSGKKMGFDGHLRPNMLKLVEAVVESCQKEEESRTCTDDYTLEANNL